MTTLDRLRAALSDRYALERELGAGGMATVYLARDLKHDRQVALKVLRPELAAVIGAERFLSEIKTTANLQHPHILPLFDSGTADGTVFYAMPFVEGESLRDRIQREKQLPVADALRIATEVASALDYAHRKGIVHRDIKPENILLHDGQALVADFGIALAASRSEGGSRLTETGMSLGTPYYMSPEQAMGEREIDGRTDIYALGCVLYEMLTGEPPFTGPTAQAIVARVMTESPRGISIQRHTVPPHVEQAIVRALEKLPADRFATAADFTTALTTPGSGTASGTGPSALPRVRRRQRAVLLAAGAGLLVTGALLGALVHRGNAPDPSVTRLTMLLPDTLGILPIATHRLAISPDGRRIAWIGGPGGQPGIVVRDFDQADARYLAGTEGANAPFFSPDAATIGFFTGRGGSGSLKTIPATGGAVQTVVARGAEPWGGDWSADGMIYYTGTESRIFKVPATGGAVTPVTTIDSTQPGVTEHDFVDVLPNGKGAVMQLWKGSVGSNEIGVVSFETGRVTSLATGTYPRYLATGHVLFGTSDGRLHLLPFDQDRLEATGQPTVVLEGVPVDGFTGTLQFAISDNGTFIHQTREGMGRFVPSWVSRDGSATVIDSTWEVAGLEGIALSPDGSRVAVTQSATDGSQIWVKTLPQGPFTRLTFAGPDSDRPAWSPDGREVGFLSRAQSTPREAWAQRADGSGNARIVAFHAEGMDEFDWSRDGGWFIGRTFGSGAGSRRILAREAGPDTTMRVLIEGPGDLYAPSLSPDSRWLAYVSDESGRAEVYVRPFPDVETARWQVSVDGGLEPLWSRTGDELFYRTERGEMMAVRVTADEAFASQSPVTLFNDPTALTSPYHRQYDVAADGRFLMIRSLAGNSSQLKVVFNWFTEIRERFGGR